MKNKLSSFLSLFIPLLLGAGLTYYTYTSFNEAQIAKMKSYFVTANYNYVYISLFLAISGYVLRAYRWKYTLNHVDSHPGFTLNFLAVCIGYFVNLSIPRSGEVSRALILKKYKKLPFDKVFGTIIAERIIDFIILLLFIFTALILEFNTLKNFLLFYFPIQKLIIFLIIGVIAFFVFLYLYFYSKWKLILWLKEKLNGLQDGALSVFNLPNKIPFLFYTILIWLSYVLMFYFTIFAFDATSHISLGTIVVAFVIGSLTITFTNGGFGFFPFLIAKILFLYGVPLEAGNAFGWLVWTSQLVITIVMGVFAFLVLPIVTKNK